MLYDLLYKSVLSRIDPEVIHDVCVQAIEVTSRVPLVRDAVRQAWGRRPAAPVPAAGQGGPFARPVPGVLGLAAGMDKEGQAIEGMDMLGFGFVVFVVFVAFVVWTRQREGKVIGQHLLPYADSGWISRDEVSMLASMK